MIEITFIRHAETDANHAHLWQGQGDSALTPSGLRQGEALGRRLAAMEPFGRVVSSDLGRVLHTARLAGLDAHPDPGWREVDIGAWEGLDRTQVEARFPEELAALRRGEDVPMGGGETWRRFGSRVTEAFDRLVAGTPAGSRVAVVTHGGVISHLLRRVLGITGFPGPLDRVRNTAVTTVEVEGERRTLRVFNDAVHAVVPAHPDETGPLVTLIRHGETEANVAGRWQGRTDGALTERGLRQASDLAAWFDGVAHVYTSPLRRARETARAYAAVRRLEVAVHDDLVETDFGEWEDLEPAEIRRRWPEAWRRTYLDGEDLPRGATGETLAASGLRISRVVEELVALHPDGRLALFSHGGAIRAYVGSVLGLGHVERSRLAIPANTAPSTIRCGPGGISVADYNTGVV